MHLPAEVGEEIVARLEIGGVGGADAVALRAGGIMGDDGEMGVDMVVVLGVVLMAGGGDEEGVEIDGLHPQALEIVQLLADARQVAAVEAVEIAVAGQLVPGGGNAGRGATVAVLAGNDIVGGVAVAEAVGENLVLDGALGPAGHVVAGQDAEGAVRVREGQGLHRLGAGAEIVEHETLPADEEGVEHAYAPSALQPGFKPVERIVGADEGHVHLLGAVAQQQGHVGPQAPGHAQADGDHVTHVRLRRGAEQLCFIAEYGGKQPFPILFSNLHDINTGRTGPEYSFLRGICIMLSGPLGPVSHYGISYHHHIGISSAADGFGGSISR